MIAGGDWILPKFGGLPRLEKPPLGYWVIAISANCFGGLSAATARLPAALSALLLAILMGIWAGRWYGRSAGLAAAVVQATSVYVMTYGRKSEVDMLLCLLTTTALFLVAHQDRRESRRRSFWRWGGVYALLSLSWLAKFHYGVVMVLVPVVIYGALQRRGELFRHLCHPVGLVLLAAGVFVWPWLVWNRFPQAMTIWHEETIGRVVGDLGSDPLWFYLPHLIGLTLPWTPFALAAVPASWRRAWAGTFSLWRQSGSRRAFFKQWAAIGDERERFLWVWLLTDLLILSISVGKHKHYLFAALPMMSLLAGQTLAHWAAKFHRGKAMLGRYGAAGLTVLFLAASVIGFVLVRGRWPNLETAALLTSGLMAAGGCTAVWLLRTGRLMAAAYTAIAVFIGCDVVVMGRILPSRDRGRSIVQFADTVRREVPTDQNVYVYQMGKHPIVYYLAGPVRRLEAAGALDRTVHQHGHLYVVTASDTLEALSKYGRVRTLQSVKPVDGLGLPKNFQMVLAELTAVPRYAARRTGTVAGEPSSKREKTTAAF